MSFVRFPVPRVAFGFAAWCAIASAACSDPVPPAARGAFTALFGNAPGNSCPATTPSPKLSVGVVTEYDKATVADGDGATVSCKVAPISGGLAAEGSIVSGTTSFSMSNVTILGDTGTGNVRLRGANTTGTYAPSTNTSCSFKLLQGDSGRIWTKFECPTMEIPGQPNSLCAVYGGIAVFENCATE
jgi:hypothetical protein